MKPNTMSPFNPAPVSRARSPFLLCGLLALAGLCLLPQDAVAVRPAGATIISGSSGAWNVPGTWIGNSVPTSSDTAVVDGNFTVSVSTGVSGTAGTLYIGWYDSVNHPSDYTYATGGLNISGGSLTNDNGHIGQSNGSTGTATVSGGMWINNANLSVGDAGMGTLNLSGSGGVAVGGGAGTLTMGNYGTLNLGTGGTAGTLNAAVVNGVSNDVYDGQAMATVNFNHTGSYTFAPVLSGSLSVTKLGTGTTILTGSNSYTGATTINDGTLSVDNNGTTTFGTLGSGAVTINGASGSSSTGGILQFVHAATAGSASISNNSGAFSGATGGMMAFYDTATAGSANITNNGGAVSRATGGMTVFYGTSTAGSANITNNGGTVSGAYGGMTAFYDTSTAGSANLTNNGGTVSGAYGGMTVFYDTSTAGSASITNNGSTVSGATGDMTVFYDTSTAGTATLTANGGTNGGAAGFIGFMGQSDGGMARVILNGDGSLDISGLTTRGMNLGSIEGSGNVVLGAKSLSVGGNNLSTTFSGVIQDGGSGGSLTKSGTGTLTLSGSSSYGGSTTVDGGVLALTGSLSTGDFYVGLSGTGALNVNGGTVNDVSAFIGYAAGSHGVATVSSGTWNSGDLFVGFDGTGTLNINGGTVANSIGCWIGSDSNSNGSVTVSSGTWNAGASLIVGYFGTGTLNISGGTVSCDWSSIGSATNSNGSVTVSSGTWAITHDIMVGISGTGTLNIGGSGVVSVGNGTGILTLASGTGSVGTLNLGTGGTAGTLNAAVVTSGSGTATVNFNHTGDYTFAPVLSGSLSVNKLGSGTTNLTGSNTYTGPTTIQSGALLVNGSITSDVTVWHGGLLGGGGTIFGNVTNQGVVSPGNSPGTLTINGNYTQTATGTLLMQLASPTVYDKLVVTGTATLGGTLQVSLLNGYTPKKGETFTYLTAGHITGAFSNIDTGTLVGLQASYLLTGTNATLEIVELTAFQKSFAKDVPGLTPNQRAVAKGLDKIVNHSRVSSLVEYLDGIALAGIPQKLEMIVPTALIPMFDASINSANVQASNLERRMEEIRGGATGFSASGLNLSDSHGTKNFSGNGDAKQAIGKDGKELTPAPISDRWGFFVNGSGEFVDEESTAIARGTDFTTGGITTGADYRLGDHAAVGMTAGYANTSANGRGDGPVKIDSGKLGLYGTVFDRGLFLNGAVGGGLNSYDTQRNTLGGLARGDANGTDFNALLGTGYTYRKGGLSAGPIASMRYSWAGIESFTERGSLAPLTINEQSEASLKSTAGLQSSYVFQLGKTTTLTPQLRAQWQHEYLDTARGIGASFLPGGAFTVYGPAIGRDSLLLDVGASMQLTQTVGIYSFYTGNLGGKNYTSHAINGGVQWSF